MKLHPSVFQAIADQAPLRVTVWKVSADGLQLLYLNERARNEAAIEKPGPEVTLSAIFPGRLTQATEESLRETMTKVATDESAAVFRDFEFEEHHEESYWYRTDLVPLGDGMVAILDLGNMVAAQRALSEIVRSSDDAILGKTLEGEIIAWNEGAERIYGYTAAEIIGKSILTLVPSGLESEITGFHERIRLGKKIIRHETRRVRKDGGIIDVTLTISPIRNPEGQIIGASTVARDITFIKKLQAKVRQQDNLERLGSMASGIAHDFNNLLVGILGNTDLVRSSLPGDNLAQRNLDMIARLSVRASELCKQMLNFSGEKLSMTEPVNVSELALDVAQTLRSGLSESIEVKLQLAEGLEAISINKAELKQLLMHLLENAIDAVGSTSGSAITISTGMLAGAQLDQSAMAVPPILFSDNFVSIEVADTGIGMDAEVQAKMFDPYFTTKPAGNGLGLAAVLGVVRNHSGGISVESEPGRGTAIKVYFPTSPSGLEEEESIDWKGSKQVVLVVDEDETVRTTTREILEGAGFQVVTAKNGLQGLDIFRRHAYEIAVVLLDWTMPQKRGEETLRAMKRVRKDVRVVLSSSMALDVKERLAATGGTDVLTKPYRASTLIFRIFRALRR